MQELPALASTVRMLSKLSQDEVSSLSALGRSVLHDVALTSCILKVANSTNYRGVSRVTTVSRACVVLGFKSLRNICITAKLLGSLLRSKTISKRVYIELVKLMSQSFHAAMLAKMIMADYDDDTQEEIFIATLLYHLGENAFWSLGGKITEHLEQKLRKVDDENLRQKITQQVIGTTFNELNRGLAKAWNLSEVLVKALDQPEHRTSELQVIELANNFSRCLASDYPSQVKKNECLMQISQLMNLDINTTLKRVNQCNQDTIELLESFGVALLQKFIPNEKIVYLKLAPQQPGSETVVSSCLDNDPELQLSMLRQLTFSTEDGGDFNQVIECAIAGISKAVAMDRVLVLMFNSDKTALVPRFYNEQCDPKTVSDFTLQFYNTENILLYVANELISVWIREQVGEKHQKLLTPELQAIVGDKGFVVSPLMVNKQCIGLIYADRRIAKRAIRSDDFAAFTHFTQLANLCLSTIIR